MIGEPSGGFSPLWRAQFEHASGEALLAALNRRFYALCSRHGIVPPIGVTT
jgi:hypothetical protein